ncbi:MAG: hypothetical protein ACTS3R_06975 [Inquilinaceae bacterium]
MSDNTDLAPLTLPHPCPDRAAVEARLRALPDTDLRGLYAITRRAASAARAAGDMDRLYGLVRGTKTLQRLAGDRGIYDLGP